MISTRSSRGQKRYAVYRRRMFTASREAESAYARGVSVPFTPRTNGVILFVLSRLERSIQVSSAEKITAPPSSISHLEDGPRSLCARNASSEVFAVQKVMPHLIA